MRKLDLSTDKPLDVARSLVQRMATGGHVLAVHVRPCGRVLAAQASRTRRFPLPVEWFVGTYTKAATSELIAGDLAHHLELQTQ